MAAVKHHRRPQVVRLDARHPRRRHRDRRRRVLRAGRPVGLRQVDAAADDRRPRGDHRRRDRDRRQGRQPRAAEGARHRDGVPELRALSAHDGARQHVVRAEAREAHAGGHRAARRAGGRHPRPRALPRPLSAAAFGRPAAARGDGPRDRARPAGVPVRRAAVEPRREAARADAHRDQGAAPAAEDDVDLRDARPDRGDDDGRPDRRDARRHRRADRRSAASSTTRPVEHVRRRLHRLAGDESRAGHRARQRRVVGRRVRRRRPAAASGARATDRRPAGALRHAARALRGVGRCGVAGRSGRRRADRRRHAALLPLQRPGADVAGARPRRTVAPATGSGSCRIWRGRICSTRRAARGSSRSAHGSSSVDNSVLRIFEGGESRE